MKRAAAIIVACALVIAQADPALAYLKFGISVSGRSVILKWGETPVRYFVTNRSAPGISANDLQAAVGRAFSTWEAVPTAAIAYQFGGFTASLPGEDDGRSTLGFIEEPELDRVLGATSFLIDAVTGELLESDIFFNSIFPWSVAAGGETNRYDLESIALHEIGHFTGLGHSALGETELRSGGGRRVLAAEAVMFPIAFGPGNISGRTLKADDIAGVSDVYPTDAFTNQSGSISGRVTKNGQGVFGAHVVAFNTATGAMVGNFSLTSRGDFSIAGLTPGPHVVRVEPLDDADVESFFDAEDGTDLNFRPAFFAKLVAAPVGGDSGAIEIPVVSK
jgi:hypothetical protein